MSIPVTIQTTAVDGVGTVVTDTTPPKTIHVPYTMQGDVVTVGNRMRKKRNTYCMVEELVTPSQGRIQPRCAHFGRCGGCSLQHMPYTTELSLKESYVRNLFPQDGSTFHPIIPSVQEWHYRNKMEFSFSQDKSETKFLGLVLSYSKGYVLNIEECHLVDPWFISVLQAARAWWSENTLTAYNPYKNSGTLQCLTLRKSFATNQRVVILTVSSNPQYAPRRDDLNRFVEAIQAASNEYEVSVILRIHQAIKGHVTQEYEMLLSGKPYFQEAIEVLGKETLFQISPGAFFQPNSQTCSRLLSRAIELGGITQGDIVYDLYCGSGTIGMCVAPYAAYVVGIELSKDGVFDATVNKERLNLTNYVIYQGDVGQVLEARKEELPAPDVVIVDPPRVGLDAKALQAILNLQPKTLISISCNPKTQAANIVFLQGAGYHIEHIQPVDQFPHTPHVENIVICRRN